MNNWREHVSGTVTAGPVTIICDGRNPGDHDELNILTWWRDDRGWMCWAGRQRREWLDGPRPSGEYLDRGSPREPSVDDRAVVWMHCPECHLERRRRRGPWEEILTRADTVQMSRLRLRDVARMR